LKQKEKIRKELQWQEEEEEEEENEERRKRNKNLRPLCCGGLLIAAEGARMRQPPVAPHLSGID
jgi:hypothetical protein